MSTVDAAERAELGDGIAAADAARPRRRIFVRVAQVAVGVVVLAAWELASGRLIDAFFISAPSAVFAELAQWVERGTLLVHASYTLTAMAIGFAIGASAGFAGLFDTAGVFAGLFVLAAAGIALNAGLKRLERHVLRWRVPA